MTLGTNSSSKPGSPSWFSRRVLSWAAYDIASSTYAALVPTLFGLYFVARVGHGTPAAGAWGIVAAASLVVAGLLSPLVGAYADRDGRWRSTVALATAACVLAVLPLPLASRNGLLEAAAAFLVAQVAYALATSVYDSYVVDIAPAANRGRVSGIGWAFGLCGGMAAIAVALLMTRGLPPAGQVDRLSSVFIMSAVMFAILAVPGVAGLRGLRRAPDGVNGKTDATFASLRAVAGTLRDWRRHRIALQVLLSFFLINDVLVTIQFFIAIVLSARFGLTVEGLLWLSLLFHLIAVPSTILLGVLADRRGARVTLAGMCVVLASAILLLAFGRATWTPTLAVVMLGSVYAAIQAVFRALYAALVPYDRAAELFGFNSIAGRLSAAVGPLLFGAAVAVLGSQTIALCLLLLPLAAGVVLLITVRLPAAYADDTRVANSARAA